LSRLGDHKTKNLGVVGFLGLLCLDDLLFVSDAPQIELFRYPLKNAISPNRNGVSGGITYPGLSFCRYGWNTASSHSGRDRPGETAFQAGHTSLKQLEIPK
jgi:hypothetical protein